MTSDRTLGHDPALTAYVAALRTALERLVTAVDCQRVFPQLLPDTSEAEALLAMETGREAQEELDLHEQLVSEGYVLADWAYHHLYGVARSPRGGVPSTTEVQESLARIQTLTEQAWALEARRRLPAPMETGER